MIHRAGGFVVVGLLLLMPALGSASARATSSTSLTPEVPVTSLAVDAADGSLLMAANGLFRSSDEGASWQPVMLPEGVDPAQIQEVATAKAAPDRLYAGGPGAGIVRSDDRGQTWRSISAALPSREVAAFAVHSFRPDTLYAAIAGKGVFRTEDGGGKWELMDEGPPGAIAMLAHSTLEGSMNTGWLYAATPDGPYLSMDCF